MPSWRRPLLPIGLYDEVVTAALRARLDRLAATHAVELDPVADGSAIDEQLVTLIRDAARIAIGTKARGLDKIAVAQRFLSHLGELPGFEVGEGTLEPQRLRGIWPRSPAPGSLGPGTPRGSLLSSGLVTNAHGESVLSHLESEFDTADRIDLLCSFIKLSGLDRLRPAIERHLARGRPLRVITTTYMHATEARAVELLRRLGAEVKLSYDDGTTRLHAKAWLFSRDSEYSTAYIGSSNLSHAAQTDGLEWNVRVAQADQPGLLDEVRDVFESYWQDQDRFEPFDGSAGALARLSRALTEPAPQGGFLDLQLEPKDWQRPILRELEAARALGRHRNLVVAATGTGKTLIAAFDYERLFHSGQVDTLLFVAHRKEILEQARAVFRHVLRLHHFGELWVDGERPADFRHVFASIQSLARAASLAPGQFDHVLIDEVHHAAADSYGALLDQLAPKELVGLTATPERADGRLYETHFPRPYVGNLRLWDAIDQQVLVPFRYFVLDVEGVDLSDATWQRGYVESELSSRLIGAQDLWVRSIARAVRDRVARPPAVRALAFCVDQAHARVVAERLAKDLGLASRVLLASTPGAERSQARTDLASGKVQVLCVVDLFNEGVDLPDVNTLFLFRPTESTTVFIQQLGRGLRRGRNKDLLTVFDATGRQHPRFRFDRHLMAMLGHSPRELREFVTHGRGRLPSGCTLQFEERAQRDVLERIKLAIPTDGAGLRAVLSAHADEGWDLATFLRETEADLLDLYRQGRSWTSLRVDAKVLPAVQAEAELEALSSCQKLLHASDPRRLEAWRRVVEGEPLRDEAERRLAGMLVANLFGKVEASRLEAYLERVRSWPALNDELRQLLPVLADRADALPRTDFLAGDVPLVLHGRYLDVELCAAFDAIARTTGRYRNFYTGVERVAGGRYDLLLVTLDKGDQKHERLRYQDFPLGESLFQWQSQASTRVDDADGRRHLQPAREGVTPLLFVRETKKDARGVTSAFRYLGPVEPAAHRGERPITIEWRLGTPLQPEWVRRWRSA